MTKKLRIFALGGNQVSPTGRVDPKTNKQILPDIAEQWQRAAETVKLLAKIVKAAPEHDYILTHGNGPQVGNILLRSEYAADILHPLPLDVCNADSQGALGYMLAQLSNALHIEGLDKIAAETVMQVVVDAKDKSFSDPSKFIGQAYTKAEAIELEQKQNMTLKFYKNDDNGNEIWRRVVASPKPIDIVEIDIVEAVLKSGNIPIAVGGGGIPVVKIKPSFEGGKEVYRGNYGIEYSRKAQDGQKELAIYSGVEAVIDKDLSTSMLGTMLLDRAKARGEELEAELTIFTDVDGAKLNFQKDNQIDLRHLKLSELIELEQAGAFPAGSMGPKIAAARKFIEGGGSKAYISKVDLFAKTLKGEAGTTITR